jgi:hypothetical protein
LEGTLALWKVGEKKWGRGDNYDKNLITNWIFSMTAKNVKLPEIWSLFVWLFLSFLQASPFHVHSKSFHPTFRFIPKARSSPLMALATPLHMYNVQKTSDWTKGSRAFRDSKSRSFKIIIFYFKKKSRFCLLIFFMSVLNTLPWLVDFIALSF